MISVVVISKDEPMLGDTLGELSAQELGENFEVVVVDASSGRLDTIRRRFPDVTWIDYPASDQITIAAQRNRGMGAARGEIVVFTDAGCLLSDGWLAALTAPIRQGAEHVTCGETFGAGPWSILYQPKPLPAGSYLKEASTINLALSRHVIDKVGEFDERFAYGSDIDYSWRVVGAGFRILAVPEAKITAEWGNRRRQMKRSFRYGQACVRLHRKHQTPFLQIVRQGSACRRLPRLPARTATRVTLALLPAPACHPCLAGARSPAARRRGRPPDLWCWRLVGGGAVSIRRKRVLVHPADSNPYLESLYFELRGLGVEHRYAGELTRSHTLNLCLLPFELVVRRAAGFRLFHLHWVFRFTAPIAPRARLSRKAMRWYLVALLELLRGLGVRTVWTAHNVLPHEQVFDDDRRARRELVARCSAVIAHDEVTLAELSAIGCRLPLTKVIAPGGPEGRERRSRTRRSDGEMLAAGRLRRPCRALQGSRATDGSALSANLPIRAFGRDRRRVPRPPARRIARAAGGVELRCHRAALRAVK